VQAESSELVAKSQTHFLALPEDPLLARRFFALPEDNLLCQKTLCFVTLAPRQGTDGVRCAVWIVGCGVRGAGCGVWGVGLGADYGLWMDNSASSTRAAW